MRFFLANQRGSKPLWLATNNQKLSINPAKNEAGSPPAAPKTTRPKSTANFPEILQ